MRKTLAIAVAAVALTLGGAGRCSGRGHHHPSRAPPRPWPQPRPWPRKVTRPGCGASPGCSACSVSPVCADGNTRSSDTRETTPADPIALTSSTDGCAPPNCCRHQPVAVVG